MSARAWDRRRQAQRRMMAWRRSSWNVECDDPAARRFVMLMMAPPGAPEIRETIRGATAGYFIIDEMAPHGGVVIRP